MVVAWIENLAAARLNGSPPENARSRDGGFCEAEAVPRRPDAVQQPEQLRLFSR
jgi:hypothetical protein